MHPEQSKPVEGPREVLREVLQRMQQNQNLGEKMDPRALISDVVSLDQLEATKLFPGLKEKILEPFGQVPLVKRTVVDGFKEAGSTGNQAGLAKYTRLAELMGITLPLSATSKPAAEKTSVEVKEPETREVELTWDDLLGMNFELCFPSSDNNPLSLEALSYFEEKTVFDLTYEQLEDYFKTHPVQTLQNIRSSSFRSAIGIRSSLTAGQVRHHLQENPLDLLRLDPRIIRADASIRGQTASESGQTPAQPDAIKNTVKQMLAGLSPDLIQAELKKNPLLALQTGEGMLDTSKGLSWGKKRPEIQLSSKVSKLIIDAMGALTPEQVRDHLRDNPLDILRVVPDNLAHVKQETLEALREEAGRLRFRMHGEVEPDVIIMPAAVQPEPPEKPAAQPEILVYYRSWQLEFGQEAQSLGEGISGKVFRPNNHPEIVVKEDKGTKYGDSFAQELHALLKLQGVPGIAQLKGYNERTGLPYPRFLVKEYVDGENMEFALADFSGMPIRAGEKTYSETYPEQKKAARWLVSSLETLAKIHARGLLVGDFRVSDFLWDAKNQRSVCIDLGNALDTDPSSKFYPISESFVIDRFKEINDFLHIFLAYTNIGQRMEIMTNNTKRLDYLDVIKSGTLLIEAHKQTVSVSFIKIINMINGESSGKKHSAQEYADALKDHFKEVGLWEQIQSQPTIVINPAEVEDRQPLTPERQKLEDPAVQQAAALARQTGTTFTEQDWTEYERWKKEQEKQG